MSKYFRDPKSSGISVKVELHFFNCETKVDFKNTTGADTS